MTLYNCTNNNFTYIGDWQYGYSDSKFNFYNDDRYVSTTVNDEIKFNFVGTKLTIKCYANYDTSGFNLKIDGKNIGNIATCFGNVSSAVVYSNDSFEDKEHFVEITVLSENDFNNSAMTRVNFDCLYTNQLKSYNSQLEKIRFLLKNNGNIKTLDNNNLIDLDSITEDNFKSNGILDLSNLKTNVSNNKIELNNNILDNGMKFNHDIDFSTLENINNIILN
jgi:hypothetical protein